MTWLDYTLTIIVAVSVLLGFWRGFVKEVVSLLIWVIVFGLSLWFAPTVADHMSFFSHRVSVQYGAAFVVLSLGALVVGIVLHLLFMALVDQAEFSFTNRLMGGIFGLVRGMLFAIVLVIVLAIAGFSQSPGWKNARVLPYVLTAARWTQEMVMQSLPDHITDLLKSIPQDGSMRANEKAHDEAAAS